MTSTPPSQKPLRSSSQATEPTMADARCKTENKPSRAWTDVRRRRKGTKMPRSGKKRPVCGCEEVSKKLDVLKNLIPSTRGGCGPTEGVAAEELFRETADYILRLKARVVLLQNLIRIYGSADLVDRDNAA